MNRVSKTAQVLRFFAQQYGSRGIPRKRLVKLAYMSDILARQYLGRPLTDLRWTKDHYGPHAREVEDFTQELVAADMADEVTERDGGIRWIRLRATGQPGPLEFTLADVEILAYVAENYLNMEMDEFVDAVVKSTDPFRQAEREGDRIPMELVDNAVRNEIGFDLERLAVAERQAVEGDSITLAQFVHGIRSRAAS